MVSSHVERPDGSHRFAKGRLAISISRGTLGVALAQSQYCVVVWTLNVRRVELSSAGKGPVDDLRPHNNLLCRTQLIGLYNRNRAEANISEAMLALAVQCSKQADT
jgi:hypothetical protein